MDNTEIASNFLIRLKNSLDNREQKISVTEGWLKNTCCGDIACRCIPCQVQHKIDRRAFGKYSTTIFGASISKCFLGHLQAVLSREMLGCGF